MVSSGVSEHVSGYTDRQMMKDFDRMLDSFFGHGERMPSVDIRQDKDSYVVRARVAGFRPDELKVDVEDHVLHISGQRCEEEKGGRKYITRERGCESFERSFTLPEDADEQRLEASCRKGVLELVVQAKAEPRRIEVKVN